MVVRDLERSNMVLKPNRLTMEQEAEMTLFYMNAWGLDYRNSSVPADGLNRVAKCQIFTQIKFYPKKSAWIAILGLNCVKWRQRATFEE